MRKSKSEQNNLWFRKIISCILVAVLSFSAAFIWHRTFSETKQPAVRNTVQAAVKQPDTPQYKHTRIADIKVGERVITSADNTPQPTIVEPAAWKKVTLYAEETWYDGTVDSINIETLVPPEWFALYQAEVGSMVPIPLDLQEMGLDENLLAKVQAIEECPEIRAGPGRVVLTTVNHLSRGVCELTYTNSLGAAETIKPTASHQFYSVDRAAWVHLSEVRSGERLRGFASDEITVVSCRSLGTTERVYNMTVEDEHVYHVGYLNLLAHNNGCNIFQESFKAPADAIGDIHGVARHVGNGKTKYQAIFDAGVTEVHYFRDSNNVKFTVFYNPKTKEYAGAHKSSGQEYD